MKISLPRLLILGTASFCALPVMADEVSEYYMSPKMHLIWMKQDHVDYDLGPGITFAFGKYLDSDNTFQLEGEIGYFYADTKSDSKNGGHADFAPVLLNFRINAAYNDTVNFQFGPSIGFSYVDTPVSDSNFDFTYGGFAGLNFKINEELKLDCGYRLLGTADDENLFMHDFYFGVSFSF